MSLGMVEERSPRKRAALLPSLHATTFPANFPTGLETRILLGTLQGREEEVACTLRGIPAGHAYLEVLPEQAEVALHHHPTSRLPLRVTCSRRFVYVRAMTHTHLARGSGACSSHERADKPSWLKSAV